MREDQIDSTRMNVKVLSQNFAGHSWALNVPSWSSVSPRWSPERLLWFSSFPKGKVFFVLFFSLLITFLLFGFCLLDPFQLTIFEFGLECSEIKINRAIRSIGVTIINNFLYKSHDFRNILGNSSQIIWILYSQLSI